LPSTDWLAKTTEAEQYVAQLKAASTTPQTIEKLENDKFAEVRAVSSMEQECESLESSVRQLQDQLKALQTKAEIMDKDAQMEEPVLAASMALFSQITNIFWDYDSQFVKGCTLLFLSNIQQLIYFFFFNLLQTSRSTTTSGPSSSIPSASAPSTLPTTSGSTCSILVPPALYCSSSNREGSPKMLFLYQ